MGEDKLVLSAIIDWTNADIWNFVRNRIGYYCELFERGYLRIGCVDCPNASAKIKQKQNRDHPRFRYPFIKAIQKCIDYGNYSEFENADDVYDWWISNIPQKTYLANKQQGIINM